MQSRIYHACRWSLRYQGHWYCKQVVVRNPGKGELKLLDETGCPEDCPDKDLVEWKQGLYPDEPVLPEVLEWDDET